MRNVALKEVATSFIIGGVPIILIYLLGNSDKVAQSLNSINPGNSVVWYLFLLLVIHCLVYLFNKLFLKSNEAFVRASEALHGITHEVGFSIQAIYRAILGSIPIVAIIMIREEGWQESLPVLVMAGIAFVICLIECCILSWLSRQTKPRERVFR